MLFVESQFQKN